MALKPKTVKAARRANRGNAAGFLGIEELAKLSAEPAPAMSWTPDEYAFAKYSSDKGYVICGSRCRGGIMYTACLPPGGSIGSSTNLDSAKLACELHWRRSKAPKDDQGAAIVSNPPKEGSGNGQEGPV